MQVGIGVVFMKRSTSTLVPLTISCESSKLMDMAWVTPALICNGFGMTNTCGSFMMPGSLQIVITLVAAYKNIWYLPRDNFDNGLKPYLFYWNVPLALACSIPSVWQQTCEPLPISQQWSLISLPGLQSHPLVLKYVHVFKFSDQHHIV